MYPSILIPHLVVLSSGPVPPLLGPLVSQVINEIQKKHGSDHTHKFYTTLHFQTETLQTHTYNQLIICSIMANFTGAAKH